MSYFCDNVCKISNNLEITGKLYFVSIYINTKEEESVDKTITIQIYLNAVAINREGTTAQASASISGTSNTTTGISEFYIQLLNEGVNLIYSDLSMLNGFKRCNINTVTTSFNPLNNNSLESTDIMKFKFDILNLKVDRQEGQTIDVFVEYRYINYYTNFNYKPLRNYIIKVLTSSVDSDSFWENLCIYIAHNALVKFKDILGIKLNFVVKNNPDGANPEPGDHGPTYTYGQL